MGIFLPHPAPSAIVAPVVPDSKPVVYGLLQATGGQAQRSQPAGSSGSAPSSAPTLLFRSDQMAPAEEEGANVGQSSGEDGD